MPQKIVTLAGNVVDEWTFRNADTQYLTHGLHPYPARMIPQLAERLIREYSREGDWVLDPFCGSGTVLVESRLRNRNSIGNEISPLALLLTRVKTTPLDKEELRKASKKVLDEVQERILAYRNKGFKKSAGIENWAEAPVRPPSAVGDLEIPVFPNIQLWFKEDVANELAILRRAILNPSWDKAYVDFFRICLSFTAMKSSNADYESHQSHPARYKSEKLKRFSPDVLSIFREKVKDSMKRVVDFSQRVSNNAVECCVFSGDARSLDLKGIAPSEGFDLIVTSPPYGEEQNTIGYHRWSRIMAYWIGFSEDEIGKSEKLSLGAKPDADATVPSKTGDFFINLVRDKSKRKNGEMRAASLASFFRGYHESIIQMGKWLKRGGIVAIVVGNRLVAGHRIGMDRVTIELAEESNLKELKTFCRDIPNTIMPKRIPEGETIARESIIILEKT